MVEPNPYAAPAAGGSAPHIPLQYVLAERGARLMARIVDSLLFLIPWAMVMVAEATGLSDLLGDILVGLAGLTVMAIIGAQLYLLATRAQSVGKRVMNIYMIRPDGQRAEWWRVLLLRPIIAVVGQFTAGILGVVDILFIFRQDRRCLHDMVAGTLVAQKPWEV